VLESSWLALTLKLETATDLDMVIAAHDDYLQTILDKVCISASIYFAVHNHMCMPPSYLKITKSYLLCIYTVANNLHLYLEFTHVQQALLGSDEASQMIMKQLNTVLKTIILYCSHQEVCNIYTIVCVC
jgi:Gamma tubulin complex component C-terminal